MEPNNSGKTKLIILAVLVIVAVAAFIWSRSGQVATPPASTADESLSAIQDSAASVDTGNLDQEFQAINKDVNAL